MGDGQHMPAINHFEADLRVTPHQQLSVIFRVQNAIIAPV